MVLQRLSAGFLLATFALVPNLASAQSTAGTGGLFGMGTIRVQVQSIGNDEVRVAPGADVYVGLEDCLNDAPVTFRLLDNLPDVNSIDVYKGENCSAPSRVSTTGEGCLFLTTVSRTEPANMDVPVPASRLFRKNLSDTAPCAPSSQVTPKLWFLPVNQSESNEPVSVYGLYVDIIVDADVPLPPRDVAAGSAEIINVSWEVVGPVEDLDKVIIYIDPELQAPALAADSDAGSAESSGGTASAACPSRALIAGQPPPATMPRGLLTQEVDARLSKFTLDPAKLGLGPDPSAIALVTIDKAGNSSAFSQVVCASAIPTQDFWEAYRNNGGGDVEGCPCSALGSAQLRGSWPLAMAFVLMLMSARRRRAR